MSPSLARKSRVEDVLVVENAKINSGSVVKTLFRSTDVTFVIQNSGAEALSWLASCAVVPKVVLLSFGLPDMDGLEVLKAIRSSPRTLSTPVIVLADNMNDSVRAAAIQLGINGFCPDTDDPSVLNDRLQIFNHFAR